MSQSRKISHKIQATPVIVLTGGGSGGHITPLLSLARALKAKNPNCTVVYIGHKGDKFNRLQERFGDFDFVAFVNGGKFRRYHGQSWLRRITDVKTIYFNFRDFFRLIGSISTAHRILKKVKPSVVFSKGSFVAVPVGIAAHFQKIPIVTHDSDMVPGLANRIIGRWANLHATGMPVEFYDYPKDKAIYTGVPIDERIKVVDHAAQQKFKQSIGVNQDSQVLLVAGGGLGARDINNMFLKIVPELLSIHPSLHIVHITGQKNEEEVKHQYSLSFKTPRVLSLQGPPVVLANAAGTGPSYRATRGGFEDRVSVLGFTGELYKYIAAADLIISRAGATAVAEFAAAQKACILIPSPFLTGGHQVKNAQQLQKIGAVEVIANDASPERLQAVIIKLLISSAQRNSLAKKLGSTAKLEAASDLADILLNIANKK